MVEVERNWYEDELPYAKEQGLIYNFAQAYMGQEYRLKNDAGSVEIFWVELLMVRDDTDESGKDEGSPHSPSEREHREDGKPGTEKESADGTGEDTKGEENDNGG